MKKLLCFIATFSLLTNTLLAPISVLAEESPTPEPTETPAAEETITPTDDPLSTPTTSLDIVITNEATPTPTPEETVNEATPTVTSEDIPSQSLESNPTVQGPPDSVSLEPSQTPTMTPEPSNENGTISAVVLENEKIDESVLNDFDLDYTEDGSATISTDKLDYSPTDTAVISGTSFVAGKTYTINITSSDEPAVDFEDTLTANDEGEILYSYTLDGNYRPNYQVKVLDGERVVAETTFLDHYDFKVEINNGDTTTVNRNVTLNLKWWTVILDPTQARYANDTTENNGCDNLGSGEWSEWETITETGNNTATKSWKIVSGLGTRKVCVETRHASIFGHHTLSGSDKIERIAPPDTTPPTVVSVSSDGQVYNMYSPNSFDIKATFSENIVNTPEINVSGFPYIENDCGDSDATTFCVTYTLSPGMEYPLSVGISGAYDAAGNVMTPDTSGHVFYVDNKPPTITLIGSSPIDVEAFSSYSDAGATAFDTKDGDLTTSIGTNNPVDTSAPGTYAVTYDVSDAAGNNATQVTRIVNVVDTTAPSVPTLVYPSNGAFVQPSGLILDWSDSTDPSLPITYYYQSAYSAAVGLKNALSSPIYTSDLNISQINASGSQDNTYYWQVQACDSQSNCSDWSGPWEVTIDGTSPVLSSKTVFSGWYNTNQISEFVYTDNLSSSLSGTPVTCVINTEGTDQTCSVSPNVCDEAGNCNTTTVASNPANIDKTNPVVNIVTPGDGNYVKGSSVSLVGNIIENNLLRYYYQIKQISTGNIITSKTVYASSLNNSTFYTWDTTGVNDGEYLIQLAARDLATNRGIESEDNITVYVDNTPPSAPTLLGDSVIYMKPGNVTRSWQASSSDDVEKYIYKSFTSELYAEDPDSSPGWSPSPTISVPGQLTYSRTDPTGSSERTFWWRVAAVDMAGNKTWSNEIYKVIVDKTAPTGDWINPTNDSTVSGIVTLNFVAQDNLSGVKDVVYKYKAVEETGFRTDGNISGNSWDTTGLTLGDYIVRAEVTDKAGNVSEFDITVGVAAVISSQNAIGVTGGNIVVTWTTDRPTTSRVVYDTVSHPDLGTGDNYGYAFSTIEDTNKVTSHSVTITGLGTGVTYYYRVISHGSPTAIGGEGYAITLTNAGPPEVSGGTTGVLGTTTGGLLAGAFPQLAITSGNEEDVENETVETGSGNTSPEPEVLGAETEASEGIGGWIKTHMGLSLGIATLIGLIIFFIIKKSKKKNE